MDLSIAAHSLIGELSTVSRVFMMLGVGKSALNKQRNALLKNGNELSRAELLGSRIGPFSGKHQPVARATYVEQPKEVAEEICATFLPEFEIKINSLSWLG